MTAESWDVRRFASLPSTNDWLLERAREGAPAGLVALADYQSAGRGRVGRRWEAPLGRSLLVSVLLRPLAPPHMLFACTAAVALATADASADLGCDEPAIKWPNDLVIDDRKVAGILAESDASAPGGRAGSVAVVIGVGCNIDWAPPDSGATTLAEHAGLAAPPVERDRLLSALLERLAQRTDRLDTEEGRRSIVAELRARCCTLGREVRVERNGAGPLVGVARALEDDGRLVVSSATGDVDVSAGDVVHLRPADAGSG